MPVGLAVVIVRGERATAADVLWVLVGECLILLGAWFPWRAVLIRVVADDQGLTVVNYRRTVRLPWAEIRSFEVGTGYFGIGARLRDGRLLTLNAIQKANAATWLNRQTRADRVVAELNDLLSAVHPTSP